MTKKHKPTRAKRMAWSFPILIGIWILQVFIFYTLEFGNVIDPNGIGTVVKTFTNYLLGSLALLSILLFTPLGIITITKSKKNANSGADTTVPSPSPSPQPSKILLIFTKSTIGLASGV